MKVMRLFHDARAEDLMRPEAARIKVSVATLLPPEAAQPSAQDARRDAEPKRHRAGPRN